jgi:CDP-diacylglycerol pyrophosphatase
MKIKNLVIRSGSWVFAIAAITMLAVQPALADRSLLWNIVNLKCLRHLTKSEAPIPCDSVDVSAGSDQVISL